MHIFDNPNVNFLKWRWQALALSVAIIGAGVFTIVSRGGLPLGVDFSGGTVLRLKFEKPTVDSVVRSALPDPGNSVVQTYGAPGDNEILVRLPLSGDQTNADAQAAQVEAALKAANVGNFTVQSKEIVGPVIGEDLRSKGLWATVSSLGGILLYIWFRFRLTFAVGAIVATFHDVLVTLVFLTWFGYDISLNVVAALLTITGYSVNDTIVIFDRVRENQRLAKREPLEAVVNRSVNQTLSRTIITAGTTFLSVVALYLFGGEVLEGLAFTLLVGIIAGTYSTIFIASAIAIILSPKQAEGPATAARTPKRA
ncbi:MAG TPA: protein translocase subunit SecF [Vicinamibacterales bacterium]|nr:protein translocase subunit SecF [Vicinamibacterales bacterium]